MTMVTESGHAFLNDADLANIEAESEPVQSRPRVVSDARMVTLYNTRTGEPVPVSRNMAGLVMRKRHNDPAYPQFEHKLAFSLNPPTNPMPLSVGKIRCMLHPEHEIRSVIDTIGLAGRLCRKSNLMSEVDLRRHMQHRHKTEWEIIQTDREERERREEREFQRSLMQSLAGRLPQQPEPRDEDLLPFPVKKGEAYLATSDGVSKYDDASGSWESVSVEVNNPAEQAKRDEGVEEVEKALRGVVLGCKVPGCDFVAEAATEASALGKLSAHKRHKHPKKKK